MRRRQGHLAASARSPGSPPTGLGPPRFAAADPPGGGRIADRDPPLPRKRSRRITCYLSEAMRKPAAILGSMLFFLIAPATVAGVVPWWITRWKIGTLPLGLVQQIAGAIVIATGAAVLLHAFSRFALEGRGTPAPVAPTEHLVVGGLYRYVRNPMYLAVLSIVVGQALLFGQASLGIYAAALAAAFVTFVRLYEEPTLRSQFGAEYDDYRRAVPGWWPQLRPWTPSQSSDRES